MANPKNRRKANATGAFYVDSTCIDCDTCRWMQPDVFDRVGGMSAVTHQPGTDEQVMSALRALVACPTASIGTSPEFAKLSHKAITSFPVRLADNVYHCGFHAEASFGATSYLLTRSDGNVLVDSPRYNAHLASKIHEMGGIKYMFLTHSDDIADHKKWAAEFACERVMHAGDAGRLKIEIRLDGEEDFELASDLDVIATPGHTKGSICLLYDNKYLFSGDHIWFSARRQHLAAGVTVCWYDWDTCVESIRKLRNYEFEAVFPGHGRMHFTAKPQMKRDLERCIEWAEAQ
ncbi:MAG: MBL fold metallo-hydrolase [Planctomycetota bacterium]|jgi:glyoxylase-like metal-dependent hydrolase (beta-lactamase superfamily II)/ferredoxin